MIAHIRFRICVFCGSSAGVRDAYVPGARSFGRLLAESGVGLVYGGASIGLMGAVADGALDAGGSVIGVLTAALAEREIAHGSLLRLELVGSMHERKARMAELADAFVGLPGGFGTFDELFEIITWAQLGIHQKPIALLDIDGYFQPLLALAEHACREGFVSRENLALVQLHSNASELLASILSRSGNSDSRGAANSSDFDEDGSRPVS